MWHLNKISILSLKEIRPIVESFIVSKRPHIANLLKDFDDQKRLELLAGTPQWTYVQIVNTFLAAKYNHKQYGLLLIQQYNLSIEVLPKEFSSELNFVKTFFIFQLQVRYQSADKYKVIVNKINEIPTKNIKSQIDYLNKMLPILQEFELKNNNPNYTGSKKDDREIKRQINENEELLIFFINSQPKLKEKLISDGTLRG